MSLAWHRGWVAEPPPGGLARVKAFRRLGIDGDAEHDAPVTQQKRKTQRAP